MPDSMHGHRSKALINEDLGTCNTSEIEKLGNMDVNPIHNYSSNNNDDIDSNCNINNNSDSNSTASDSRLVSLADHRSTHSDHREE